MATVMKTDNDAQADVAGALEYLSGFGNEHHSEALEGAYSARGAYGQYITVIPKLDVVIALKTNAKYQRSTRWSSYRRLIQRIIEAKK